MPMTRRGKRRLTLLIGALFVAVIGVAGAVVVRDRVRARLMQEALAEGRDAYESGEFVRAMDRLGYYVGRADEDPETMDAEALYLLAEARRREPMDRGRHLSSAAGLARRASELMPDDPRPVRLLMELFTALGYAGETLEASERLLELLPGDAEAMWTRAMVLSELGRRGEAAEAARAMLESHPGDDRPRALLVNIMVLDGRPVEEVLAFLREQAEGHPDDLGTRLLLAEWQARARLDDEARDTLREARSLPIETARDLAGLVAMLDAMSVRDEGGERPAGDAVLARAAERPELQEAAARIGAERLWKRGDAQGALNALTPLVTEPSDAEDDTVGLTLVLAIELGDEARAEAMEEALSQRTSAQARHWLALAHGRRALARSEWTEAISRFSEASSLSARARNDLIAYWSGAASASLGEQRSAIERYEAAVRADPTWQRARAALLNELLSAGRNAEAVRQAASFFGATRDATLGGELGFAIARVFAAAVEAGGVGQITVEDGLAQLERAAESRPESGDLAALHLRALAAAGRIEAAQDALDRILDEALPMTPSTLRDLHNAARRHELAGVERLAFLARDAHPENPDVLFMLAMEAARAGRVDEGRALFREAMADAPEGERLGYERAMARFLVNAGDPDGVELLKRLAEEHPEHARVQIDLLETDAAWAEERVVEEAINRLGALSPDGVGHRVFEARRLLTFLPSDEVERDRALASAYERLAPLLRSEPPVVPALLLASEAAILEGNRAEAIELLARAAEYDPRRRGVFPRLIELLQAEGRRIDAERRLRDYAQQEGLSVEERRRRAELLMNQGLWDLAAADAEALAADCGARDLFLLALARQGGGDLEAAGDAFRRLLDAGGGETQMITAAADFFARRDGFEAGLSVMDRLPAELTPEERVLQRAAFFERHGRMDEAASMHQRAVEEFGGPQAWAELARMHVRRGDIESATSVIEEGLAAHPDDASLKALAQLSRATDADALNQEEIAAIAGSLVDAGSRDALTRMIEAGRILGADRAAGLDALRDIVDASPTFFPARQTLVAALLNPGEQASRTAAQRGRELEEAVRVAQDAINAMPTNPRAAQLAYETLYAAGQGEQALSAAREWRRRTPLDAFVPDMAIAGLLVQLGRPQEAVAALAPWRARIEASADERPQALVLLANALAAAGRAEEAHALLWPRVEENEEWARAYLQVAGAVRPASEIMPWIDRLEPIMTGDADRIQLANLAYQVAGATQAPEIFRRVIELASPHMESENDGAALSAMMLVAVSFEQLERVDEAIALYRRMLEQGREEPVALNNLAYLSYTEGGSLEESIELAQRAVDLAEQRGRPAGERAVFLDTLAELLAADGSMEAASQRWREAIALDGSVARFHVGLAEALAELGRFEEAEVEAVAAETIMSGASDPDLQSRLDEVRRRIESRG